MRRPTGSSDFDENSSFARAKDCEPCGGHGWRGWRRPRFCCVPATTWADGVMLDGVSPAPRARRHELGYADNGAMILDNPAAMTNVEGDGLFDVGGDGVMSNLRYRTRRGQASALASRRYRRSATSAKVPTATGPWHRHVHAGRLLVALLPHPYGVPAGRAIYGNAEIRIVRLAE